MNKSKKTVQYLEGLEKYRTDGYSYNEKICEHCGQPCIDDLCECRDFIGKQEVMLTDKNDRLKNFPSNGNDLRDFREHLTNAFLQTQIALEHVVYLDKKAWSDKNEMCEWIFATPNRQMMFWMFAKTPIVNGWTVAEAADYLKRDRTSVSKDLSDMHSRGYIYRNNKDGFQRHYLPSATLLNNALWFSEYYVDTTLRLTELSARRDFFEYRASEREYFKNMQKRGTTAQ